MMYQDNQTTNSVNTDMSVPANQPLQQQHQISQAHTIYSPQNTLSDTIAQQLVKLSQSLIKKCRRQTSSHNNDIKRMKKYLLDFAKKISDTSKQRIAELQLKSSEENQSYETANKQKQAMINQLQKQLANAHQIFLNIQKNKKQVGVETEENTSLALEQKEILEQDDQISKVKFELIKIQGENIKSVESKRVLQEENKKINDQNKALVEQLQRIKLKNEELEKGWKKTEKQAQISVQVTEKRQKEIEQMQQQINELNKTLEELCRRMQAMTTNLNQKTEQSDTQKKMIIEKDLQIHKLKESLTINQSKELAREKKQSSPVDSMDEQEQQLTEEQLKILQLEQENEKLQREIKQMEMLSGLAREEVRIMNQNLRQKQIEIFELSANKNNRIEQLEAIICSREQEIYEIKNRENGSCKGNVEHLQISHNQRRQESYASRSSCSSSQVYCDKEKQEDILQAELEILKCKYKLLEKMYLELKHSSEEQMSSDKQKNNIGIQVRENELQIAEEQEKNGRKSVSNASQKPLKKTLTDYNLPKEQNNLDMSLAGDSIKGLNKNSTLNSPQSIPTLTLNSFFTSSELETRIKNFSYTNSILYKINSSKFITSPSSKMAFIIQYACFLQLYFSNPFLASVLEDMIMGEDMQLKELKLADLNVQILDLTQRKGSNSRLNYSRGRDDSSIMSQSSSRALSSANLHIGKQLSMNCCLQIEGANEKRTNLNCRGQVVQQTIIPTENNGSKIQEQMKELQMLLSSSKMKQTMPSVEELSERFKNLKKTGIARYILKILSENEAMKKCLNVMLKNQQLITKSNNQVYFENADVSEIEQGEGKGRKEAGKVINEANCLIM